MYEFDYENDFLAFELVMYVDCEFFSNARSVVNRKTPGHNIWHSYNDFYFANPCQEFFRTKK